MTPHSPLTPRVIKHGQLKARESAAPIAAPGTCAAPAVRLVRSGDVVKSIRVDCLCGRSIEIECIVDEPAVKAMEPRS